jgi:hypothetical protein
MKRPGMAFILILSLLLNLGVLGAVGYRAVQAGGLHGLLEGGAGEADLPGQLKLNAGQRQRWEELERGFLRELALNWEKIRVHRETMIREIFSERPDSARVEAERAAIAQLQAEQQKQVIAQLLRERDVLDAAQRRALADVLIRQAPAGSLEERLHRQ